MPFPIGYPRVLRRRERLCLVAGLIGLAAAGLVALRSSEFIHSPFFPKCPLHLLTGLHCPGCGSARALHALAHGDLAGAWSANPLLMALTPLLAGVWGWRRIQTALGRPPAVLWAGWIWLLLAAMFGYALLRNLPWYPFTLLAPH